MIGGTAATHALRRGPYSPI